MSRVRHSFVLMVLAFVLRAAPLDAWPVPTGDPNPKHTVSLPPGHSPVPGASARLPG